MNRNGNATGSKPLTTGFPPLLIIPLEGKGGVGKSGICDTCHASFSLAGASVVMIDGDTTNSQAATQHDATLVDTSEVGWHTAIGEQIRKIGEPGGPDVVIFDPGARAEVTIKQQLGYLEGEMAAKGGRVLIIRPVTTSPFAMGNALDFVSSTKDTSIAVVLMEMHIQGRMEKHFDRWRGTKSLARALGEGAVTGYLEDLGVVFADEAVACRLSFSDIARGNFTKPGANPAAREFFTDKMQLWCQDWLKNQKAHLFPTFLKALEARPLKHPASTEKQS